MNRNNIVPSSNSRNQNQVREWGCLRGLVLIATGLLFVLRLGDHGVVSEELRWAEVAREMRLTGDYFHPTINGQTYYDKPIGSYWLIVAASYLTGGVTEASARLPAAVAGWVGVLLVMGLARRWYGEPTGVLAGVILVTSFGFAFYARRASADVETVTGVLAAVCLFDRYRSQPPGWWVIGLWAIMGVTSQMKGLLGFALPVAVFWTYGTWTGWIERRAWVNAVRNGNRWLFNWWTLAGGSLGVFLFFVPFALSASGAGLADGLGMVYRENLQRFFRPHNHTGPVYLYVGVIFVLAAPWSAFLPSALVPHRPFRDSDRLAWTYFLAVFLFFTAASSRRSYYLLPVLPAVAILVAAVLAAPAEALTPIARRLRTSGYLVFAVFAVFTGVLAIHPDSVLPAPHDQLPPIPARWWFLAGWAACSVAVVWGLLRPQLLLWVTAGVTVVAIGYVLLVALPATDEFRTRRAFALEVRARTNTEPDRLALYHARDLTFDLGCPTPVPEHHTPEEIASAVRDGRTRWVVARRRYWEATKLMGGVIAEEAINPWDGADQLADKMVLIDTYPQGAKP